MNGKLTAIVLGAGASHCYDNGTGPLPLQRDIVGKLGSVSATSGIPPDFATSAGLQHSLGLAEAIARLYGIDPAGMGSDVLWSTLRDKGETLETVYAKLSATLPDDQRRLLIDFGAILRASVRAPIPSRGIEHACQHHRALVEALDPGDYIVSFNWDSLVADALIYYCPLWFPSSGFGGSVRAFTKPRQKGLPVRSLVHLYPIHGSVVLYQVLSEGCNSAPTGELVFVGPPGVSEFESFKAIYGFGDAPAGSAPFKPAENWAVNRGYVYNGERWFRPLFVPPSMEKLEYAHPYHRALRTSIHMALPLTERFVIAGYSFPLADRPYLTDIFSPGVIRRDAEAVVVNPECSDSAFQERANASFSSLSHWDFSYSDFRKYCTQLASPP
jgi:hypothetical protein